MRSIIWNLTKLCPWNCSFCCVAAKYVKGFCKVNEERNENHSIDGELSYSDKVKVIDQLQKGDFRIDFSGGDLLIDPLNIDLVLYASKRLGKENVGISISGAFVTDEVISKLKDNINDVEITMDNIPFEHYRTRPVGYHEYSANAICKFREEGVTVGVQTVLTKDNMKKETILKLYNWLERNDVNEWSLLRFFSSGRGKMFNEMEPSYQEYYDMVSYIKEISAKGKVKVHFQYLLPNHEGYTLQCRAVRKSIGILPNGMVTGCFWGLDEKMCPTDKKFELGWVPKMNIYDILNNSTSEYWMKDCKECRIFTYDDLEKKAVSS